MSFLAPLWLTLLVPWALLTIWLWRRTVDEATTTAVFLWQHELVEVAPRRRTMRRRPAAWMLAALVALLMLILSLAAPARSQMTTRLTVLIDASASLAAEAKGRSLRAMMIESVEADIDRLQSEGVRIDVAARLIGLENSGVKTITSAKSARFTAAATASLLDAAIADALARGEAVVVLTDATIASDAPRLIVRAPTAARDDVGIVFGIATDRPMPSLMVRIANDSSRTVARLGVRSTGWSTQQDVTLPPRGETIDVFFDLPPLPGETIEASLIGKPDDFSTDDHAFMHRSDGGVSLTLADNLPPIASRFAAAYERSHASAADARTRVMIRDADSPTSRLSTPAIHLPHAWPSLVAGALSVVDHPLSRDIDFASPSIDHVAPLPPGEWTILARHGDVPLLAVRETPTRDVWIGFELDAEQLRSVVLLNNAVEWLADASPVQWIARHPEEVAADWQATFVREPNVDAAPGFYVDGAGRAVAIQMPAVVGPHGVSRGDLADLLRREARAGRRSLRSLLAIAAAIFAVLAAILTQLSARQSPRGCADS